jgi:hypothetical protein
MHPRLDHHRRTDRFSMTVDPPLWVAAHPGTAYYVGERVKVIGGGFHVGVEGIIARNRGMGYFRLRFSDGSEANLLSRFIRRIKHGG